MLTESTDALAGESLTAFFAGVASVQASIQASSRGKKHPGRPQMILELHAQDRAIVHAAREHFRCGKVDCRPLPWAPEKDQWTWKTKGLEAADVMRRLSPYMRGKNADRVRSLLKQREEAA